MEKKHTAFLAVIWVFMLSFAAISEAQTMDANQTLSGMALPESQAAVAKRARACCRGTLRRGYGFGRRLHARGS
jgi:hypothetical protein